MFKYRLWDETLYEIEVFSIQIRKLLLGDSNIPVIKLACNVSLASGSATSSNSKYQLFVKELTINTNNRQKTILDLKISEFFYANNVSFNIAGNKTFIEMINALLPGLWPSQ